MSGYCGINSLGIVLAVQVEELVLPAQHLTALVELATVDPDVLVFCGFRQHDEFPVVSMDVVNFAQGR